MSYRVQFTDEAADLLLSIADWYRQTSQSIDVATRWYDGFIAALENLKQNPFLGSIAAESDQFGFELRELLYRSGRRITHRAIYRVVGNVIEILSIRHHSQQPLNPNEL